MFQFHKKWKLGISSGLQGKPKLCFEPHISWISIFCPASSVFFGVKTVVGNVSHPILGKFCVRVRFFSIGLLLLVAQIYWKKGWNFNWSAFSFFWQRFILGRTADLHVFMLHKFLSKAFVKIVCSHNSIPHKMRCELICGIFQLYIWRPNS